MHNIETSTLQPQLIAIDRLERSPLNARRTGTTDGMAELKASILAHGLMQNLVVTDAGGTYHVIAGGRRLEAIRALIAEGKLPEAFAVPCQVVSDDDALELSLAENTIRLAMHPADQFEAFSGLIAQGHSAAQVAQRFGTDESRVVKLMKLARVAPALLAAYREDAMTLECLMAFTVTDDRKRQLRVFKSLQGWQQNDPAHIRACLTDKMIDAGSKLARFVGLDAYQAAGGTSRADLFGDTVYLEKPALLHRLADTKLAAIRTELEAEGWGWIEINPERDWSFVSRCSRIQPKLIGAPEELVARHEQLRAEIDDDQQEGEADQALEGLQEQLSEFIGFDARHKGLAGCYVSIGQDGTPFIDKGLVRPEHKKQLDRMLREEAGDDRPETAKPKDGIPQALRRELAAYRQQAAQVELARHPAIALDLLAFQVAQSTFADTVCDDGLDVDFNHRRPKPSVEDKAADERLDAILKTLPIRWLKPKTEAARFEAFRALPDAAKLELLAYCVALTLKPSLAGDEPTACDAALALTGADVASYWRPTKANFLGRIPRDQLLALGRETIGEAWSQCRWKDKKTALAEQLERAFADPGKGRPPEQAGRLARWLPAGMAFIAAPAQPAKAKKARKAA